MKNRTKAIVFILIAVASQSVHAQWQLCNSGSCNYFNHCFIESSGTLLSTGCISNDSGSTWAGGSGMGFYSFEKNSAGIFAGTDSAIYFSSNNGSSWTNVYSTGLLNVVYGLAVLNDTVFAATRYSGILMSPDNGLTWITANSGLPGDSVYSILVKGNLLFAGTYGNGIYMSSNSGSNWISVNSGLPVTAYVRSMAAYNVAIYASTGNALYLSNNNGLSWLQAVIPTTHVSNIITVGNAVLAGGYNVSGAEGMFRSLDNGVTWSLFDNGLPNSCAYVAGALYATTDFVFCGMGESFCPVEIYRIARSTVTSVNQNPENKKSECDVFPNPFSGELNVQLNNNSLSEITVYDITSRALFRQTFTNSFLLNTQPLAKGVYTYEVRNKESVIKKGKVVKE